MGIVGGVLEKFKFENYINDTDILMDFGCGGGYLLNNFNNKIKFGYEINQHARDECRKKILMFMTILIIYKIIV